MQRQSRERNYNNSFRYFKDDILRLLAEKNKDIEKYLAGETADIILNGKDYKIFQIERAEDLRHKIKELAGKSIRDSIIKTGLNEKSVTDKRTINEKEKNTIEEVYNIVLHKYKVLETIEQEGFIDIVFAEGKFKKAPRLRGRATEKKKEKTITFRLSAEQEEKLKRYCEKNQISDISEAIRRIIERA